MSKNNPNLSKLVSDIVDGKISLMEILQSVPSDNYLAHVNVMRLSAALMSEPKILKTLQAELEVVLTNAGTAKNGDIDKELGRKDGKRRFSALLEKRAEAINEGPRFLTGANFDECLDQYKTLISYVEHTWSAACDIYKKGGFAISTFLSILVIEETAKLSSLWQELATYDAPKTSDKKTIDRNHRRKHFIGVMSGALINARLERVLGKDTIRKLLHDAESDELEKLRQGCLYIDVIDGKAVVPNQHVSEEKARTLVVFAGELMAEVLGHFPWEWQRMLGDVISFEREIGLPEEKIKQQ